MNISRRSFLKTATIAVGAAATLPLTLKNFEYAYRDTPLVTAPPAAERLSMRETLEFIINGMNRWYSDTLSAMPDSNQRWLTNRHAMDLMRPLSTQNKVYDWQVICDERNNPPSVIDEDDVRCDIYLKFNPSLVVTFLPFGRKGDTVLEGFNIHEA